MSTRRPPLVPLVRTELQLHLRHGVVAGVAGLTALWVVLLWFVPGDARAAVVAWVLFLDVATVGFYLAPALVQVERANGVTAALRLTRLSPHQVLGVRLGWLATWAVLAAAAVTFGTGVGWAPVVLVGAGLTALFFAALAVVLVGRDETLTSYLPRIPLFGVPLLVPAVLHGTGLVDHPALRASPATGALDLLFGRWSWGAVAWLGLSTAALWWAAQRLVLDVRPRGRRSGRSGQRTESRRGVAAARPRRPGPVRSFASVDRRTLLGDGTLLILVLDIPLLAVLLRLATGPGLAWFEGRTGVDLVVLLPLLWALVLVVHPSVIAGSITGLLFLEDRDAGLFPAIATTRAGLRTLIGYRLSVAAALTAIALTVALPIAGAEHRAGAGGVIVTAVASAAASTVPALLLASLVRDRAAGTALMKAIGLPLYLPLAWWFVDGPAGWLFAVVPTSWAARAFWAPTMPAASGFAAGAIVVSATWVALLLPRLRRSVV